MNELAKKIRPDFAALHRIHKKKPVIYFDNACMTLKPKCVTDAVLDYYNNFPGCHGRTNHLFGAETTKAYDAAREKIRRFFNAAHFEEIIFVRNSTEGLNLLADTIDFQPGDIVVSSDLEHNSNLLPWQILEKKRGIKRLITPTNEDTTFNIDKFRENVDKKVKLVSIIYTSNLTGVSFPVEDIIQLAHQKGALVCLDAAQSGLYRPIDVQKLNVDFLVTSIHKMWGPTGVGVLYGKKEILEKLPQFLAGGETIYDTTYDSAVLADLPDRFEAGLQDYAGVIGAGAAVDYIKKIGREKIYSQVQELNEYAGDLIAGIAGIKILGPANPRLRSSIVNMLLEGIAAADVAKILNESENIMVRFGKHCVNSWFNHRKLPDSLRVSFSAYNTSAEIDVLTAALKNIMKFFKH